MALTLHARERHAPATPTTPAPLPPIAAIKRAHAPAGAARTPSAAMKRMALLIACAAVYFAFSATFEPSRSQARMNADAAGLAQARALLPASAPSGARAHTGPDQTAEMFRRDLSAPAAHGDQAP